jgi:glycosyltransferase involved in cell wall biosynthesis
VPHDRPVAVDGVQVRYFRSARLRRLYHAPDLGRALDAGTGGFDLVHTHTLFAWPPAAAARAARRAGVPYLLSPRGMLVRELVRMKSRWVKTAWLALLDRANLEGAAALHVTSAIERDAAAAFGYTLPPMHVIPNAVDLDGRGDDAEPSAAVAALTHKQPLVLFLGRVSWKKGLDRLVRALPAVPGAHLAIAGTDEENHVAAVAAIAGATGVAERVHFTGFVGPADKRALLRAASLLVLPSYNENFGNVVLEAMAASCPVVVTPEVGAGEVVRAAGCGEVAPGEPAELGRAIARLVGDSALRERMGRAGRAAIERDYSWPAVAARMERVYESVLGDAKRRRGR